MLLELHGQVQTALIAPWMAGNICLLVQCKRSHTSTTTIAYQGGVTRVLNADAALHLPRYQLDHGDQFKPSPGVWLGSAVISGILFLSAEVKLMQGTSTATPYNVELAIKNSV